MKMHYMFLKYGLKDLGFFEGFHCGNIPGTETLEESYL